MKEQERQGKESGASDSLRQMFTALGEAFSEVFNDPELKAKAREFGDAATESAIHLGRRFKDDDVRERFRQAGEAAEEFGRSVADYFRSERRS